MIPNKDETITKWKYNYNLFCRGAELGAGEIDSNYSTNFYFYILKVLSLNY